MYSTQYSTQVLGLLQNKHNKPLSTGESKMLQIQSPNKCNIPVNIRASCSRKTLYISIKFIWVHTWLAHLLAKSS